METPPTMLNGRELNISQLLTLLLYFERLYLANISSFLLAYLTNECTNTKTAYRRYIARLAFLFPSLNEAITKPARGNHKKNFTAVMNSILVTGAQSPFLTYHTYIR